MVKNPVLLYKSLVVGVIVLFIGMSVVSSTVGIAEDKSSNNYFLESVNNQKGLLSCDHLGYVYYLESNLKWLLIEFILDYPGDITYLCVGGIQSNGSFFRDFTWSCDDCIYCVEPYTGVLWGIDPDSCNMWEVGGGGEDLNGLAYDPITNRMFGVSNHYPSNDRLWQINPDTGYQEYIGEINLQLVVGMAFDAEGVLYGWDLLQDSLHIIDPDTLEVETVGPLGINLNAPSGDFCREDDTLFLVNYNGFTSYLYEVDKETGDCEFIGSFFLSNPVSGLVIPYECYDTTPPVTTYTLDPPEPDGNNGWYVSNVNVTLNATDDLFGVKEIRYKINGGAVGVMPGDTGSFILSEDGEDILVEFRAVDIAGNVEDWKSFTIDIDQTEPDIAITYEVNYDLSLGWILLWYAETQDATSGMERVEFYINNVLQETVYGPGPVYEWIWDYCNFSIIKGFIRKREVTEEYVKFRVIFAFTNESINYDAYTKAYGYDNAGNKAWDMLSEGPPPRCINWILLFKSLKLPNNYTGYVGRFLIHATFYTG